MESAFSGTLSGRNQGLCDIWNGEIRGHTRSRVRPPNEVTLDEPFGKEVAEHEFTTGKRSLGFLRSGELDRMSY